MQVAKRLQAYPLFRNKPLFFVSVLLLSVTFVMVFPDFVYASPISDAINGVVSNWLNDMGNTLLQAGAEWMNMITVQSALTSPFNDLFGNGNTSLVYEFVRTISNSVIKPVAHSILALVMLLQLVKISQKSEGNDVLPMLKDIIFLLLFYALFLFLINNAADVCQLMYSVVLNIVESIQTTIGASQAITFNASLDINAEFAMGQAVLLLLVAIVFLVVSLVAALVTIVISYARAFQLYALTAFSPIPFGLLGFEETRSWGVGYIKTFLSVCFAGAIMVFLLMCFPLICAEVIGGVNPNLYLAGPINAWSLTLLKLLGLSILLLFGLVKSGSWARDIFGG